MKTVEEYILSSPADVQEIMERLRSIILNSHPDIVESMAYGMPAYKLNKRPLVYFGAFKNHIGFYATPTGHAQFQERLSKYKQGKGSVQFPYAEAIPFELIKEMVEFRIENLDEK